MRTIHQSLLLVALMRMGSACSNTLPSEERFAISFSGSEIFDCWRDTHKIGISVGSGLPPGTILPPDLTANQRSQILQVNIGNARDAKVRQIDRLWGLATFTDGDQQVSVALNNGKTAHFARFGPTPDWPFKAKKDSQLFFPFRLDEGPTYRCKVVYQPDQ